MLKLKSGLEISAVGAASKPREDENSYMPCFLAGLSQGSSIAEALELPFCSFSHQQGHVAAAAWSAGRLDLLDTEHLAWHISGGTTELLLVRPNGRGISCESIGGTTDLAAGQLIDRAGGLVGLNFQRAELDELSRRSASKDFFAPRVNGLGFSLSGVGKQGAGILFEHKKQGGYGLLCSAFGYIGNRARDEKRKGAVRGFARAVLGRSGLESSSARHGGRRLSRAAIRAR